MMKPFIIALSILITVTRYARADDYPRNELLVEPITLAKADTINGFVILDARAKTKYENGHLPGARWVDHTDWAKSFGDGQDSEKWSKRIGRLGLTADSHVVVYDDNQAKDSARIW
ncbi:MAG: rhodanese-like domain-containing protein [Gemmataceae bacterium]